MTKCCISRKTLFVERLGSPGGPPESVGIHHVGVLSPSQLQAQCLPCTRLLLLKQWEWEGNASLFFVSICSLMFCKAVMSSCFLHLNLYYTDSISNPIYTYVTVPYYVDSEVSYLGLLLTVALRTAWTWRRFTALLLLIRILCRGFPVSWWHRPLSLARHCLPCWGQH